MNRPFLFFVVLLSIFVDDVVPSQLPTACESENAAIAEDSQISLEENLAFLRAFSEANTNEVFVSGSSRISNITFKPHTEIFEELCISKGYSFEEYINVVVHCGLPPVPKSEYVINALNYPVCRGKSCARAATTNMILSSASGILFVSLYEQGLGTGRVCEVDASSFDDVATSATAGIKPFGFVGALWLLSLLLV